MELRSLDDLLVLYIKERMPSVDMVRQLEVVIRSLRSFTRSSLLDELTREALFGWRDHLLNCLLYTSICGVMYLWSPMKVHVYRFNQVDYCINKGFRLSLAQFGFGVVPKL